MRTESEIKSMLEKLGKLELKCPQYLKEGFARAGEILEWVLGNIDEEDVILFDE